MVTGGAGNVGSGLARRLVEDEGNFVVIVDNLSTGRLWKLPQKASTNWKFIKADVNRTDDFSTIMAAYNFDTVFHYAAVVGVQRTLENPILVLEDIDGIRNVLRCAKNSGVKRVYYSSSSEVYGEPVEVPQREATTPLNSRLPYAIVKNVGEAYLRSFSQEHGLEYTIFRFFNTYGPRQSEDFVITRFLRQAMSGRPITVYGDGSQTRTFCHIDDNVSATVAAFTQDRHVNDTVNIGSDEEVSVRQLAEVICQVTGSKSSIQNLPPLQEGDMTRRCPSIEKMLGLLGRRPLSLREGIQATIDSADFQSEVPAFSERRT
ncbi:NAD-dependent epimerase/dehydratase family protein [bacterium]|nr:NAD-dependent epimerase/dehydratase family protein [bacterium]